MKVIGLTGGIGSGKSTAAAILGELGAMVISADLIGHEVYAPGTPGFTAVVDAFGDGIVGDDGQIDRRRLGAMVFADPARLARLNAIVHPLIREKLMRRVEAERASSDAPAVVIEAAILLEAGWRSVMDEVWLVTSKREDVFRRLAEQRGLTEAETEARMAHQMSEADRRAAPGVVVIENDGSLDDLRDRVVALWRTRVAR
jgi:dephospho-CoA kinase